MQPTHVITRPFFADGLARQSGEAVDVSGWLYVASLEKNRKLRLLRPGEKPKACACGRLWVDAAKAEAHCKPEPKAVKADSKTEQVPA